MIDNGLRFLQFVNTFFKGLLLSIVLYISLSGPAGNMKGSRRSGIIFPASRVCLLWRSKESTFIAITDGISLDSPFVSKRVVQYVRLLAAPLSLPAAK
ncbi:MAG: hypothetical protein CM15mP49_00470 [Actinomycetota bacterium]|nr:MAG: hypothetical protein CM15mP49_00470 [Actinomycetota bacterium]